MSVNIPQMIDFTGLYECHKLVINDCHAQVKSKHLFLQAALLEKETITDGDQAEFSPINDLISIVNILVLSAFCFLLMLKKL